MFSVILAFGATKAEARLFMSAFVRRLGERRQTTNVVHPGLVCSGLMREMLVIIRTGHRLSRRPTGVAPAWLIAGLVCCDDLYPILRICTFKLNLGAKLSEGHHGRGDRGKVGGKLVRSSQGSTGRWSERNGVVATYDVPTAGMVLSERFVSSSRAMWSRT